MPLVLRCFGGAGQEYMERHGVGIEVFAKIRAKASRHAARNPLALFRKEISAGEVLQSPVMWPGVMTRLMACPPTCGAAAAVLVSESLARRNGLLIEHSMDVGMEISDVVIVMHAGTIHSTRRA